HERHHGRFRQGSGGLRQVRAGMDWEGKSGEGSVRLLRQAGLSGTESARRSRPRANGDIAGFLSRQGHHPEEVAGRGTLHQSILAVARVIGSAPKDPGAPRSDRQPHFRYPSVPCQPCLEISKITPSGSLNLRSKLPCRSSPRSKKNLPPLASIRFCVSARSSTWKPKGWAPTCPPGSFRSEALVPAAPVKLSKARLITPSLI